MIDDHVIIRRADVHYFHGGISGLDAGDHLVPTGPHVFDGCPICEARAQGRTVTVGQYRAWLRQYGEASRHVLRSLEGALDYEVIDPPSAQRAVYITSDLDYATWYAARSGHGDLYEVVPVGPVRPSTEDLFPSWTCAEARVARVLRRAVHLTRTERRRIAHRWKKAERRREREGLAVPL